MSGSGTFDIGRCVSEGWQLTIGNLGVILGVAIVGAIVGVLGYVTIIGIFLVLPVLAYGGISFLLNVYDKKAQFGDLFSGFSKYGQALGSMLLLGLCFAGIQIVGQMVYYVGFFSKSTALIGLGGLISLVWVFAVVLRFYFAPFFVVDQGQGAIDALKASWGATGPQKLNVILLALVSAAIGIAGFLALIVGIFVAGPMIYLMWVSAFRQMAGSR
jgi:hypothetical protein